MVLDRRVPEGSEDVCGIPIVGDFSQIETLITREILHAVIAVGNNDERSELFRRACSAGLQLPTLVHPSAIVDSSAIVGNGSVVCAGAIIGVEARVGDDCIINTGAIIDHETQIGDHAHIAPRVAIAGRSVIGELTMVGIGTSVKDKVRIGRRVVVGAGSVVVRDLDDGVVAYGCPARPGCNSRP